MMAEEEREWGQRTKGNSYLRTREAMRKARRPPAVVSDSPLLDLPVNFTAARKQRVPVTEVMAMVARQCQVTVLAHYLLPDYVSPYLPPGPDAKPSLGDVLAGLNRKTGMQWRVDGRYVVGSDEDYLLTQSSPLPEPWLARLRELVTPDGRVKDPEQVASLLAQVPDQQWTALSWATMPPELENIRIPASALRAYGYLEPSQRRQLEAGRELQFSELSTEARRALARQLRPSLPEEGFFDPEHAVIYRGPWTSPSGKKGFYIAFKYRLPDGLEMRELLFNWPVW